MRLYTLTDASGVDDPEFGHFDADDDGGFDFPDPLSDKLHRFHIGGKAAWENDVERQNRLIAEELERRKDPATLLDAVQQLVQAARSVATPPSEPATPAPAKRASKRTTTKGDTQ